MKMKHTKNVLLIKSSKLNARITDSFDPNLQTFQQELPLMNSKELVRPKQSAHARFNVGRNNTSSSNDHRKSRLTSVKDGKVIQSSAEKTGANTKVQDATKKSHSIETNHKKREIQIKVGKN